MSDVMSSINMAFKSTYVLVTVTNDLKNVILTTILSFPLPDDGTFLFKR